MAASPLPGGYTQISITTGGTAQYLAVPYFGFEITNCSVSDGCWMSEGTPAVANTGVFIAPGQSYWTPPGYKPIGAPSVLMATTADTLTYRAW